jgi:hypothetical protein
MIQINRWHFYADIELLKKLYKRAKKSVEYVDGYFHDPGGATCKILWSLELVAQFVL